MPQTVNREAFLHQLEAVQAGLSTREIIEQSSCLAFQNGRVYTYNDEVACSAKLPITLTGAVQATPLLSILRKLVDDELTLEEADGELILMGKSRRCGIRREAKVLLPITNLEKPGAWKELHADFPEGVAVVSHCASKDASRFALTCVHLHPEWVEACDVFQASRAKMATGIETPVLVKSDALKNVTTLGMTHFAESQSWIHFKNPGDLRLSCRRYLQAEDFPKLDDILYFKGDPITLPKGLGEAAQRASVFSSESADDNQVLVELRPGKLRVKGTGATGWFHEIKKLTYNGPELSFMIDPTLLEELVKRHSECEILPGKLRVDGGKFQYVTALGSAVKDEAPAETPAE